MQFKACSKAALVSAALLLSGCQFLRSGSEISAAPSSGYVGTESYRRGNSAFLARDWQRAEAAFLEVPKNHELYPRSRSFLGQIAAQKGDLVRAVALMKEAEKLDPKTFARANNHPYAEIYARILVEGMLEQQAFAGKLLLDNDFVFIQTPSGTVMAVQRNDFRPAWSYSFVSAMTGGVALGNGTLSGFVDGGRKLALAGIDTKTGKERFRTPLRIGKHDNSGIIAADGGRIFVASTNPNEIQAFDATTGQALWSKSIDGEAGPITIAAGRIFVATKGQTIYGIKPEDGHEVFTVGLPIGPVPARLVATDTKLIVHGERGRIYALDATERSYDAPLQRILWEIPATGSYSVSTPAAAFGKVWVPRPTGVEVYDIETGKLMSTLSLDLNLSFTPTAGNGAIAVEVGGLVLATYANFIVAFEPNANLRWIARNSEEVALVGSTAISLDGRILVGGVSKRVPTLFKLNPNPSIPF